MKVAFFADITSAQLTYLRNLAQDNNIQVNFVIEGENTSIPCSTPITGEMLQAVSTQFGKTVLECAILASQYSINTVEEALKNEKVPAEIKAILEGFL